MEGAVERDLVLAARLGDEVAFARLIEAEAPRTYRAVLAVVRSPEDAQEVMQDATIRAWRQLRGLRDAESWPAWFRRIAIRQAIDCAGRRSRTRLHEIGLDAIEGPAADDPTARWADQAAVMAALRLLTKEDRAVLGVRFGADLAVADVAAVLGIPLGTAKSRIHRALGRLATAMGDDDVRR
jgi:RNA polymerase sigma factor (sigma-70 family)